MGIIITAAAEKKIGNTVKPILSCCVRMSPPDGIFLLIKITPIPIARPTEPINVLKMSCEIIPRILETSIHLSSTLILSSLISFIKPFNLR
jgi:hypothetical protein